MKKLVSFIMSVVLLSIISWIFHTTTTAQNVADTMYGSSDVQSFIVLTDKSADTEQIQKILSEQEFSIHSVMATSDTVEVKFPFWTNLLSNTLILAVGFALFSITYKLLNKKSELAG